MNVVNTPIDAPKEDIKAYLSRISESIDPLLRRHCGTWTFRRLVSKPRDPSNVGVRIWHHLPSVWTIIPALLTAYGLKDYIMPWGPLSWLLVTVIIAAVLFIEIKILPFFAMSNLSFQLMRFEKQDAGGKQTFIAAKYGDLGFDYATFNDGIGKFHVGEVVALVECHNGKSRAIIRLFVGEKLTGYFFERNLLEKSILPPMTQDLEDLAREFGMACNEFIRSREQIDRSRRVVVSKDHRPVKSLEGALAGIMLDPAVKTQLITSASHFRDGRASASKGLLLYGPPGTGKTLIAKALAESMGCTFFARKLSDLKAGYTGQSAGKVQELWKQALAVERAVIFLDECDGVFGRRDQADTFVQEIVSSFIAEWDGFEKQRSVWVIGATNRKGELDGAVLDRFSEQVEIGLPGPENRMAILKAELRKTGYLHGLPEDTPQVTQGMGGRDLERLAGILARDANFGEALTSRTLIEATAKIRQQVSTSSDKNAIWDNLALPDLTMQLLKRTIKRLKNAEALRKKGVNVPRALLLYGPPGTGKTQIARTLANEGGMNFVSVTTADLKGSFLGHSGKNVKRYFAQARENSPAILFIDEIDLIAPSRGDGDVYTGEMVGQLLQEMEGVASHDAFVFVLAATNLPDAIDPAIRNRFEREIEISLPDDDGRRDMLEKLLAGKPTSFCFDKVLPMLVAATAGKSGRDIRNFVNEAADRASIRVDDDPDLISIAAEDFIY